MLQCCPARLLTCLDALPYQPALSVPAPRAEMGVLYSAQRMARALLSQGQAATAAKVAQWAAKQPRVMGMLKTRLRQHARQVSVSIAQ